MADASHPPVVERRALVADCHRIPEPGIAVDKPDAIDGPGNGGELAFGAARRGAAAIPEGMCG
jgi:hypothetical protein